VQASASLPPMESIVRPTRKPAPLADTCARHRPPSHPSPLDTSAPPSAEHSFAELLRGVRTSEPEAVGRLTCLVSSLLQTRLSGISRDERTEILSAVVASVGQRVRSGALHAPQQLLDAIEATARRHRTPATTPTRARIGWLDRLARMLVELEPTERCVLEGLYVHASPTPEVAERLGLTATELDEARRRGLRALRSRLAMTES